MRLTDFIPKKHYYGMTVSGLILYFDTFTEAKDYFKNFPIGTFSIKEVKE